MTVVVPLSARNFARSLVWMSIALFIASCLAVVPVVVGAVRLYRALDLQGGTTQAVALIIAFAPAHVGVLSPLLAKRILGARAGRLLPAGSILVVTNDGQTWRLFAHATVATGAVLAFYLLASSIPYGVWSVLLNMVLGYAVWLYRLVAVTFLWLLHAISLRQSVAVLSHAGSGYRQPAHFILEAYTGRREVVIERVDGAHVELKFLDAAGLAAEGAARPDAPIDPEVHGVKTVWRAAGPRGAEAVASLLGRS